MRELLLRLFEFRGLSPFERRKRRLQSIPLDVAAKALENARKGLPLSTEQYIAANLGFLPGEREALERARPKTD